MEKKIPHYRTNSKLQSKNRKHGDTIDTSETHLHKGKRRLARKDMNANQHERLFNIALKPKFK